jgi:phage-related protein
MPIEVGSAYVTLMPSMKGFSKGVERGIGPQMGKAGSKASGDFAGEFEKQSKGRFKKIFGGLGKVAGPLMAVGGGMAAGAFFKDLIDEASNAQQSIGATEAIFGKYSDTVIKKSEEAAQAVGLSGNQYRESSNLLGALLKNQGVSADELASKTDQLVGLGADLAAMYGGDAATAVDALTAAYKGEYNSLEKYGVSLTGNMVNQEAMTVANVKSAKEWNALTQEQQAAAKQQAVTNLLMKQSKDAQGQAARESDTYAGQMQRLGAQFANLKESLGSALLPVVTKFAEFLNKNVVPAITGFIDGFKEGTGWGGKVREMLSKVGDAFKSAFTWVKDNVVPTVQNFVKEFREGEGVGGKVRDVLEALWKKMQDAFGYVKTTVIPALQDMWKFLVENKDVVIALGAAVLTGMAAQKAWNTYIKISTAITKAWTVAQKALNLAMKSNLVGIIVTAIAALIGILVVAYKKHEGFRNFVNAVWAKIKEGIAFVVTWFQETAWPIMQSVMAWIGEKATWLWNNAIKPAFNFIWGLLQTVFAWLRDTGWPIFKQVIAWVAEKVMWAWNSLIKPYFNFILNIWKTVFNWIKDTGWPIFRDAIGWIGEKATWLWDNAIKPAFDFIKEGIGKVITAFQKAKDGIGTAWDKVRQIVAKPIVAVLQFVNDGIIGGINKILDWVKIPGIPKIPIPASLYNAAAGNFSGITSRDSGTGRSVVARAMGGVLPGWSPGRDNLFFEGPAGTLALSGGEAVMRPEWTKAVGTGFIDQMNAAARHGGVNGVRKALGFKTGGVLPGATGGGWWDTIASIGGGIVDFAKDPLGTLKRMITNGIDILRDNPLVDFVGGFIDKTVTGLKDKVWDLIFGSDDGDMTGGKGSNIGYKKMIAIVQGAFPDAGISSSLRSGKTASGFTSYHSLGRAIDIVASPQRMMEIYGWLTRNFGASSPEIYYGPGGFAKRFGKTVNLTGITAQTHPFNHVHWAAANGGVLPTLYDQGGLLNPGLSLVSNQTKKPEYVFTDEQIASMGGNTIVINGVDTDKGPEVAQEMLFALRRTNKGKYNRNR